MAFRTKIDYSTNRQILQREKTFTTLSGSSTFGVAFSALTTGADENTTIVTEDLSGLSGTTFSGNDTTTIFSFADPRMALATSTLSAITPTNFDISQNTGDVFTPLDTTIIDGNIVTLTYTGVNFTFDVETFVDLGGSTYSGTAEHSEYFLLSAGTLDFTERTIWIENPEITRTDRLIVKRNPALGHVLTCVDNEGMCEWLPFNPSITGLTIDSYLVSGSTGVSSIKAKNSSGLDATNNYATAFGFNTLGSGEISFAEGYSTTASGYASHAEGFGTTASGLYSHAQGRATTASGDYGSHAEGDTTTASGNNSHAEGAGTTASGYQAHAEGLNTIASGNYSHAEGTVTTASGEGSHAQGNNTIAIGDYSHAEGLKTQSKSESSHAEGDGSIASGNSSHAEGHDTLANGHFSHSEGLNSQASGYTSHAEGGGTLASGAYSHAEGSGTTASGAYAHSQGRDTIASGNTAHAEGRNTLAGGETSHAEGFGTTASGYYSHAENFLTTASGDDSHAEGHGTISNGHASHAEGLNTIADGDYSHAQGSHVRALGLYSHAGGKGFNFDLTVPFTPTHTIVASGTTSFVHYTQTAPGGYIGAYGDYSAILGGTNHNINTGATSSIILGGNGGSISGGIVRSVVIGGNAITAIADDTVYMPDVVIDGLVSVTDLQTNIDGLIIDGASDISLKTNINELDTPLDKIKKLRGVSFDWKPEARMGDGTYFGLIAQEVNEVIPEIVKSRVKNENHLTLDYKAIIPWLVEAVKELSTTPISTTVFNETQIETQTITSEDSDILLNFNGTHETSLNGGLVVNKGVNDETNSQLIINSEGDWLSNTYIIPHGLVIPEFTPSDSSDTNGKVGEITRDDDYLYIKGNDGQWKRSNLETF